MSDERQYCNSVFKSFECQLYKGDSTFSQSLLSFYFLKILFMAVLGLHCYKWAFCSCGESGAALVVGLGFHCCGCFCCRAQARGAWASVVVVHRLNCPAHVGSSRTRTQTRVPCVAGGILNCLTTREAPLFLSFIDI